MHTEPEPVSGQPIGPGLLRFQPIKNLGSIKLPLTAKDRGRSSALPVLGDPKSAP